MMFQNRINHLRKRVLNQGIPGCLFVTLSAAFFP